jgi:hypothetical protein
MKTIHNTPDGISLDTQIYPLELLAATAARLLNGNDYDGAVEGAVALLNACKRYQGKALRNKTVLGKIEEACEVRKTEERPAGRIPFNDALEKIYGRSRLSRNVEAHLTFTAYRLGLLDQPQLSEKVVSQERKRDFLPSEVATLAKDYKAIPRGEWRVILDEYKRHLAPTEKNKKHFDAAQKPVSGKKRRVSGK